MELDLDARRILQLADQARSPSEDDKARIERRLALGVGAAAVTGLGITAARSGEQALAAKAASATLMMKVAGTASALLLAVSGYLLLPAASPAAQPAGRATTARPALAVAAAPQAVPAPVAAPALAAVQVPEQVKPSRTPASVAPERRHYTATDTLPAELELLHRAQASWRAGDAETALSLVHAHRARHPRSALRSERDTLEVLALCAQGRKAQATRIARRLLASAPHSPLRAAIEQSCALQ